MKKIMLFAAILFAVSTSAQVNKVTIQASGLTCSLCSNAINKALKSVEYIDKVYADIKNSSFDLSFKPGSQVDFDQLKKKVEGAGFFVAKFSVFMNFDKVTLEDDAHVVIHQVTYHFLNIKDRNISGEHSFQVLDKGYVSAKTFKKNAIYTKMDCYKTGVAGTCCTKSGVKEGNRIYHVMLQ